MYEDAPGTKVLANELSRTLQVFARAARARQLSQPNNIVLVRLMSDLGAAFQAVLQRSPEISLRVRSDAFVLDGEPVLEEPNPDDSIPFTFFRDGIRRLDIQAGLTAAEIEVLVAATTAGVRYTGLGDDLVSYLWRHDLEHLRYVVVDTAIVDAPGPSEPGERRTGTADELDQEIDALLTLIYGDSSDDVGPKSVRVDADDIPAKKLAESLDQIHERIPGFHPARAIDVVPVAAEALAAEVAREDETRITLRAFSSALDALATPLSLGVSEGLFDALLRLFDTALVKGDLDLPARMLLGVRELGTYEHARASAERWMSEATQDTRLRQATQAFTQSPDIEKLRGLAGFFRAGGSAGAPALLSIIPRIEKAEFRRMVSALVLEIGVPSLEPVLQLLAHEQAYVAQEAVFLLHSLGTQAALSALRGARAHPQPMVRLSLLAAARKTGADRGLELARIYLNDADAHVVELAAHTLVELEDATAAAALEERIQAPEIGQLSPVLRRVLFAGYAQMKGALAVPALGRVLRSNDEETQLAAIAALGTIRTPGAIAALRQVGFSFNKRIRNAVKEALESSSTGGPGS